VVTAVVASVGDGTAVAAGADAVCVDGNVGAVGMAPGGTKVTGAGVGVATGGAMLTPGGRDASGGTATVVVGGVTAGDAGVAVLAVAGAAVVGIAAGVVAGGTASGAGFFVAAIRSGGTALTLSGCERSLVET